jgi:hypothetical protein
MKKKTRSRPEPEVFLTSCPDPPPGWEERFAYFAIAHDGTIFLPAVIVNRLESDLLLCASFDGEPLLLADKHTPLFRTEWLKQNYPNKSDDIDFVVARIRSPQFQRHRAILGTEPGPDPST